MNKIQLNERYCIDIGVKVSGNEKGTKRLTMEKVFKSLDLPRAWKKVKKGDTVIIRTGMNGKDVDVAKIEYFNPNVVQIIARGGSANLVDLKNVGLMVPKIANEGYRSYKDSVDVEDKSDAWGKVVFGKSSEKAPDAVKKHFDRQSAMAQNKEYQAAKKKWLAEMDKFLDGKISVQPKMPRIEDFLK